VPSPRWLAAGAAALGTADLVGGAVDCTPSYPGNATARFDAATYLDQESFVTGQGFAATANLFVRADVARALGGFDPTLQSGGDVEFCRRATAAGHLLGYAPDAVVWHEPRATLLGLWRLHRRLGAGWAALAARGDRPGLLRDEALRWPTFGMAVAAVNRSEPALRRRALVAPFLVARAARWTGRITGH
jgi:GT2 family glycosyltransferase